MENVKKLTKAINRSMQINRCTGTVNRELLEMSFAIEDLSEMVSKLFEIITEQNQQIQDLQYRIYEMCPESEVIDSLTEDKAKHAEMVKEVMNLRTLDDVIGKDGKMVVDPQSIER